jgi:hypothetical protein
VGAEGVVVDNRESRGNPMSNSVMIECFSMRLNYALFALYRNGKKFRRLRGPIEPFE